MVISSLVRREKLDAIRKGGSTQKQKLFYQGQTQLFDVFRIDLDLLIYNRHNGRLEAEMLTWEQENAASPDVYDDALHKKIDELLWQSSEQRNAHTLEDLKNKGQQRPGIVSLDGVIIDGNRRAMLLRRLEGDTKTKMFFDGIILPDAYADNQKEIVRLETQYQLGEDSKVEYGPLQKYLHVRRLCTDLGIPPEQVDELMDEDEGNTEKLLEIMELMDDYLAHIECPRLYTLLGTKEGMFVDLHADLKRLKGTNHKIPWVFDETELAWLRSIQFDYMRAGEGTDGGKSYRDISHGGKNRNFFAQEAIWKQFKEEHDKTINVVTAKMGSLDDFMGKNSGIPTREAAAKARDKEWKDAVSPQLKAGFGRARYKLNLATEELRPTEYLKRAMDYLERIDIDGAPFLTAENKDLVFKINALSFEMKKKFDRAGNF